MLVVDSLPRVHSSMLSPLTIPNSFSLSKSSTATPAFDQYATTVEKQFRASLQTDQLLAVSAKLQEQFREKLSRSDVCMLPAYTDSLPDGSERGTALALDLGGSWLRVAWIQLSGRSQGRDCAAQIIKQNDYAIDESTRALQGRAFFSWMARRISEAVQEDDADDDSLLKDHRASPLPLGLSWSFPVEQISRRDVTLMQMGKDFRACDSLIGHNLGDLLEGACREYGLNVAVQAVVNDSTASLLSEIYVDSATTMAVILGTGLNAAISLPSTAMAEKLSAPSSNGQSSSTTASVSPNVLVNTELSMFGKNVLKTTPWDDVLNMSHSNPDYQPLEHLTSGRYLGEIVRLVLVNAIETGGLFGGETPKNFGPYALQTSTVATIESDQSPLVFKGGANFSALHPLPSRRSYKTQEIVRIRDIITLVSDRAAAYMATAVHALWRLKCDTEATQESEGPSSISCLGSVLAKYPRFRERMQDWLDRLAGDEEPEAAHRRLRLELTSESDVCLIGAAVAATLQGQSGPTGCE